MTNINELNDFFAVETSKSKLLLRTDAVIAVTILTENLSVVFDCLNDKKYIVSCDNYEQAESIFKNFTDYVFERK